MNQLLRPNQTNSGSALVDQESQPAAIKLMAER
jgi:hypothetical protein